MISQKKYGELTFIMCPTIAESDIGRDIQLIVFEAKLLGMYKVLSQSRI